MNFLKITLLVLIVALVCLSLAESREDKRRNYKLFGHRRSLRHYRKGHQELGRQHTDNYNTNNKIDKNDKEDDDNTDNADNDDLDEVLNNLDLDDANRILFLLKGKYTTTTAAPVPPPIVTPPPVTPPPATPPPVTPPPPTTPTTPTLPPPPTTPTTPTAPVVRRFNSRRRIERFDF